VPADDLEPEALEGGDITRSKAKEVIEVSEKEKLRAVNFISLGMHPLDALHLALAEAGNADYFCTCDDRLLRNAMQVKDLLVKVINPVDLIQEIEK
jgi:predicted nucleic acid-binding protein